LSVSDDKFRIWDAYWRENRLCSFGLGEDQQALATLENYWASVAQRLVPNSAVLDLACGNGAAAVFVAQAAARTKKPLSIAGIDEAVIEPARYVKDYAALLARMEFRGKTTMEALPFPTASFDCVISQFGLEYGNPVKAVAEAARVTKTRGILTFVSLPAHSPIVQTAKKVLKQGRYLLRDTALFSETFRIIKSYHEGPADGRDQRMRNDLEQFNKEVEKTVYAFDEGESDVVFTIITGLNRIFIDRKTAAGDAQALTIDAVRTGLAQYAARAHATIKAALNEASLAALKHTIVTSGFRLVDSRALLTHKGTIAWQFMAERQGAR
jgi:ubiquinone/menaquinone biosynthesis C-methylase UbiE